MQQNGTRSVPTTLCIRVPNHHSRQCPYDNSAGVSPPGGARKKKSVGAWGHRAQHMVASVVELTHPISRLDYAGEHGERAERSIYLFDQVIVGLVLRYFAEYRGRMFRTPLFIIYVSADSVGAVSAVAQRRHKI
jgi:hypothetical protein